MLCLAPLVLLLESSFTQNLDSNAGYLITGHVVLLKTFITPLDTFVIFVYNGWLQGILPS